MTWSCNAKANVPRATLKVLADNGLRLLLVGYESGHQGILNNIRKGVRLDLAREFTRDATHLLLVEHVRVEDDGGRIAAEAFAREGVDMKQAAFALGHGGAESPGPGEEAH